MENNNESIFLLSPNTLLHNNKINYYDLTENVKVCHNITNTYLNLFDYLLTCKIEIKDYEILKIISLILNVNFIKSLFVNKFYLNKVNTKNNYQINNPIILNAMFYNDLLEIYKKDYMYYSQIYNLKPLNIEIFKINKTDEFLKHKDIIINLFKIINKLENISNFNVYYLFFKYFDLMFKAKIKVSETYINMFNKFNSMFLIYDP